MAPTAARALNDGDLRDTEGFREVRLFMLDARSPEVRRQIAEEVRNLNPEAEEEALRWIEAVGIFGTGDADAPR